MSSPKLRLELSPIAQQDFIDILRHTGKNICHLRDELPKTHRIYFVGSHVIIYRTLGEVTSVVRILHQRMSLTKMRLSQFVDIAASGEDVVASRHGKPLVRITQLTSGLERRIKFGILRGKLKIAADFDAPLPGDVLSAFDGR